MRFASKAWGVLLFALLAGASQGHAQEIWFTPAISLTTSSPDWLDLFTQPELWPKSRSKINVFKLISWQVLSDCPNLINTPAHRRPCGNNLIYADVYKKLKEWNISLALEAGVIKPHDCVGNYLAYETANTISFLQSMGIRVDAIAMDEPLVAAQQAPCNLPFNEAAERVVWWIQYLKTLYPDIKIGDIGAFPFNPAAYPSLVDPNKKPQQSLQHWMLTLDNKLRQRGLKLDFFHMDVDMNHAKKLEITDEDWQWQFQQVANSAKKRGIAFGVIINANTGACTSSCQYVNIAQDWLTRVRYRLDGYLDHLIFQSWDINGIPINLPETGKCTHTGLIKGPGRNEDSEDDSDGNERNRGRIKRLPGH